MEDRAKRTPGVREANRLSPTKAIALFIFVLVTTLFLGVVVTTVKDLRIQEVNERLIDNQQELQRQVALLQERLASTLEYASSTPTLLLTLATSTSRTLITPDNVRVEEAKAADRCKESMNAIPATSTVAYVSLKYGISARLPYHPDWAEPKYRLNPYDEVLSQGDPAVAYGPMVPFEACTWQRLQYIRFIPPRSAASAMDALNDDPNVTTKPTATTVNGLTVLRYVESGLCAYPTLEVIGKKNNFVLQPLCGGDEAKDFAELNAVAETIRLVE